MSTNQELWAAAQAALLAIQQSYADELAGSLRSLEQRAQEIATQQAHINDLTRQLYRATHPADVYATVDTSRGRTVQMRQCLAVITNEFLYPPGTLAVAKMAPYVHDLYEQVSYHLSGGFGLADAWEWNPANGPRPAKPTNLGTLVNMVKLVNRFGRPHLLTIYRPSWHLKRQRGRALTFAEAWGPGSNETGRLAGEFKPDWQLMVNELCYTAATEILRADPEARIDCEIHNEFKGMWELLLKDKVLKGQNWADGENPGTPGFGDIDYGPYYALTVEAALAGFARAKLPRERVRFGGPYAVLQSRGKRTANALPVGHPLADRPWGHMSKMPICAFKSFLAFVKKYGLPLDFAVFDGGTYNNDDVHLVDIWGQLLKIEEANAYIRFMLEEAGLPDMEIVWAERYLTERPLPGATTITPEQDAMARRAAVTVAGLGSMAWSGAGRIFQWGLRGEDGDPRLDNEQAAYFRADGSPTMLYDACLTFKKTFPAGCQMSPIIFEGDGIGGWASDDFLLLYNKTSNALKVALEDQVVQLSAYEIRRIAI